MKVYALLAAAAASLSCAPSYAGTIFFDDFEAESEGLGKTALTNFTVTGGNSVDIVGPATDQDYGMSVASKVIDMDGSPGPAILTSNQSFSFNKGAFFRLFFDAGGAQRGSEYDGLSVGFEFDEDVTMLNFGSILFNIDQLWSASATGKSASVSFVMQGTVPMTTQFLYFTAGNAGSVKIMFRTHSEDGIGALVDNVGVQIWGGEPDPAVAVPEPASWAMMIGGFAIAGAAMRRRKPLLHIV